MAARPPFMSAVPRPKSRPSRSVGAKGSELHCSAGPLGTTSVCPANTRSGAALPRRAQKLSTLPKRMGSMSNPSFLSLAAMMAWQPSSSGVRERRATSSLVNSSTVLMDGPSACIAQEFVDAHLGAGLGVHPLHNHRAAEAVFPVGRGEAAGHHHRPSRHPAVQGLAALPIVDAGALADEYAHGDHRPLFHHHPFDDLGAGADEALVLDDGRGGLHRFEDAADAGAAGDVYSAADLGAGADGGAGVHHGTGPHVGADVHVG